MSRRPQDARTAAARWRSLIRSVVAGAIAAAVRKAAVATVEAHLGRKLSEPELAVLDDLGPARPFASGGPVGLREGEVPAILSRGHELPYRGHPYSFTSLDGLELGRDNEPLQAVRAQVVKAHANGQEAVLYVIEDGVAREVGRVPPGGLQLQLDRKPRW